MTITIHVIYLYTAPSPLETTFSFIISDSGNSVDVCVETKEAAALKLVLRDSNKRRHVRKCKETIIDIIL